MNDLILRHGVLEVVLHQLLDLRCVRAQTAQNGCGLKGTLAGTDVEVLGVQHRCPPSGSPLRWAARPCFSTAYMQHLRHQLRRRGGVRLVKVEHHGVDIIRRPAVVVYDHRPWRWLQAAVCTPPDPAGWCPPPRAGSRLSAISRASCPDTNTVLVFRNRAEFPRSACRRHCCSKSMTILAFLPRLRHRQLMPTAAPTASRSAFLCPMMNTRLALADQLRSGNWPSHGSCTLLR